MEWPNAPATHDFLKLLLCEFFSWVMHYITPKYLTVKNLQGWEVIRAEHLNQFWKEKYDEWLKRPKSKLDHKISLNVCNKKSDRTEISLNMEQKKAWSFAIKQNLQTKITSNIFHIKTELGHLKMCIIAYQIIINNVFCVYRNFIISI